MNERSEEWLAYFRGNAGRASPSIDAAAVGAIDPERRAALVASLGRFYLGETGEGRIAHEVKRARDPALDDATCECVALYVREEGRHAREIAAALAALGAPLPEGHWSESLFRRGRRLLGLRTKMMTIAAAEVVGAAYYGMIAERVAPLAATARAIRRDERMHLAFQAEYFARVARAESAAHVALLAAELAAIVACAIAVVAIDHAPLLGALGVARVDFVASCLRELGAGWRARSPARSGARPQGNATPTAASTGA